jgi:hypothetical protein
MVESDDLDIKEVHPADAYFFRKSINAAFLDG